MITDKDKAYLLSLKPDDLTKKWFDENCSRHFDPVMKKMAEPKFNFQDKLKLKKNEYANTTDVETNVGQLLINKYLYEAIPNIQKVLGYVAEPITNDKLGEIESGILSKALLDGKITSEDMGTYFDRIQWLGNTIHTNVAPSFTEGSTKNISKIMKVRDKLYEENKEALAKGDAIVANKIEKELITMTKEELKDDIGLTLYTSGARGSFENNYKNLFLTRGPVYNPNTGGYQIIKRSFMEGLEKDDVPSYGTEVINGAYPKAIGTAVAGYATKKFFAAYQSATLDKRGTDCGSKAYRKTLITKKNYQKLIYRYIVEGNTLVMLDNSNIQSYIGKVVNMRSPLYCVGDKLCSKCAGDLYYRLGIENIGMTTSAVGSGLLKLLMKAFHDSSVKISEINIDDIII